MAKIKFNKLKTNDDKVSVNFGSEYQEYDVPDVNDSGIEIPDSYADYSAITLSGEEVELTNPSFLIKAEHLIDSTYISKLNGLNVKNIHIPNEAFKNRTDLTSIDIPDGITSIGSSAFYGCFGLTKITIPNSVTSIESDAFSSCTNLTSIDIPNSVTSIGNYAFQNCYRLTEITISDSVTSIGDDTFAGCAGLTEVTIPNGVTSIGDEAFCECTNLTNITIPDSVISIGDNAFYNCTNLHSIYYTGTEEQWNSITKGDNWNYKVPSNCQIIYS